MAVVIAWARPQVCARSLRLGAIRSAILVMRLMTAFIGCTFGRFCFGRAFIVGFVYIVGICLLLLGCQLRDRGYGDVVLPLDLADLGSSGKHPLAYGIAGFRELPVRRLSRLVGKSPEGNLTMPSLKKRRHSPQSAHPES